MLKIILYGIVKQNSKSYQVSLIIIRHKEMTEYSLLGVGTVLYILAMALVFKDCHRGSGSTMGGDMLAGVLWALGSLFLAPGICLLGGVSLLWTVPLAAVLYLAGLPCRAAVARLGSKYGKPFPGRQSSGFAEHIRRTKTSRNGE